MAEAAVAPPPSASPTPSPTGANMEAAFAGFDALVAEPTVETPPDETPPDETPPTETPPDEKPPDEKPPDKKPETPPVDKKTATPPPKPGETKSKAATLRDSMAKAQAEAADWKGKYEKLVAETSKPKADPEKEQLVKDREAWNKRQADLENELKFANYERSQEYKDKYQQPFMRALDAGGKLVTQLTYKEPDKTDEFGAVIEQGKTRKANEGDWETLMGIPDEETANKFIADHFGYSAARVAMARDKVLDLHHQMRTAVEDFRKQGVERETQMRTQHEARQKEISVQWHAANQRAAEKFPQYFAPDPADAKATELLQKGASLTDFAFGVLAASEFGKLPPSVQSKMVNGQLPQSELTLLHSAIRNRSAAYDRLVYNLGKERAARTAAEAKLKDFEASEPKRGSERKVEAGNKKGVPASFDEIDAEFDRLAAGNG